MAFIVVNISRAAPDVLLRFIIAAASCLIDFFAVTAMVATRADDERGFASLIRERWSSEMSTCQTKVDMLAHRIRCSAKASHQCQFRFL
jgi:hypothetical protein